MTGSSRYASLLAHIPPDAVLPLAPYTPAQLAEAARADGQRYLYCDCQGAQDKDAVLLAIARALQFPAHFGLNFDALYDCLTDLRIDGASALPGFVVVIDHLPGGAAFDDEERDILIDVFRDAAEHFVERGCACRVFYA